MTAVVIGVRWAWIYTTPYLIRPLDRRPQQRLRRVGARQRTVSAVAGFRGAVSLAAVLAVPQTLDSGAPFPDRDLIVLITCGVIVLTLLQALAVAGGGALRAAARRQLRRRGDPARRGAHPRGGHRGDSTPRPPSSAAAPRSSSASGTSWASSASCSRPPASTDDPAVLHDDQYTSLSLALIGRRREALLELRDAQRIDDIVLRRVAGPARHRGSTHLPDHPGHGVKEDPVLLTSRKLEASLWTGPNYVRVAL